MRRRVRGAVRENRYVVMDPVEKARLVAGWLEDKLGKQVLALDLRGASDVGDTTVLVTADNVRHAQALADQCLEQAKEHKIEFLGMEGYRHGHWILVDMNDCIVHVLQPAARTELRLEGIWPKAPVLYESAEPSPDDMTDKDDE